SRHDATTKRPADEFRFRRKDVDLDLVLSTAFLERVRQVFRAVVQVETGSIDEEKLGGLLGVDGDFYGSWPIRSKDNAVGNETRNLARGVTYLVWLRDELDRRTNGFDETRQRLQD